MNGKDRPKNLPVIVQMIMAIHNNNNSSTNDIENSDDKNWQFIQHLLFFIHPILYSTVFASIKKRVFFHPSMGQWNNTATRYLQKFKNMFTHNSYWSSQTICSQQVKLYCEQNSLTLVHKVALVSLFLFGKFMSVFHIFFRNWKGTP